MIFNGFKKSLTLSVWLLISKHIPYHSSKLIFCQGKDKNLSIRCTLWLKFYMGEGGWNTNWRDL